MDVWKSSFLPFLLHFSSYTSFPPRSLIHNVNGSWWSLSKVHWCAAGCWNSDSMCADFLGICSLNIKQSPAVLGAAALSWNLICCYMHQWFVTFFEGTEVWAFPCWLVCQLLRCLYPLVNRSMTLWLPALLVSPLPHSNISERCETVWSFTLACRKTRQCAWLIRELTCSPCGWPHLENKKGNTSDCTRPVLSGQYATGHS